MYSAKLILCDLSTLRICYCLLTSVFATERSVLRWLFSFAGEVSFLLAVFKIFSLSSMLSVSWWLPGWGFLSIYSAWDLLGLLSLRFAVFYQFWKILICFLLQCCLLPIVLLLSFWDSDLDISRPFFFDSELMFLGTLVSDNSLRPEFKVRIFILCQWLRGLY